MFFPSPYEYISLYALELPASGDADALRPVYLPAGANAC
jgi:hypothetical protein